MQVIVVDNYEKMSIVACDIVSKAILNNNKISLGLATGGTPKGLYMKLIQNKNLSWENVTTFNLDEYIGIKETNKMSYRFYMNHKFFNHINININNTYVPKGIGNIEENAKAYDNLIKNHKGIDLQILGLGENAHIAFNEPGSNPNAGTSKVKLAKSTINVNARYFATIEDVPTEAITMGIGKILQAKQILLLASGLKKAHAIKATIEGNIHMNIPSSFLQNHNDVTIIIDKAAASLLKNQKGI